MDDLTLADLDMIITSLEYTRLKFDEYSKYPSYEYKQSRISEVNATIAKVAAIRKTLKGRAVYAKSHS